MTSDQAPTPPYPSQEGWLRNRFAWVQQGPVWRCLLLTTTLCILLPPFFSWPEFPDADGFTRGWDRHWDAVVEMKVADPFRNPALDFAPQSNEAKRGFRLVVPLFAHLTNTGLVGVHAFRFAMQAVLVVCLAVAALRVCGGERLPALALSLVVMGTYVGTNVWRDPCRWFDNCAHAFIALALAAQRPWLVSGALVFASFTDERSLLLVPLVYLYHHFQGNSPRTRIAVLASIPACLFLRLVLAHAFGLSTPLAGVADLQIVMMNLQHLPTGVWFSLEGGWLITILAGVAAWRSGMRMAAAYLIVGVGIPLLAAVTVIDFSRSASYAFPATFAAMALLRRPHGRITNPAFLAAAVSLVVPNIFVMGNAFPEMSAPIRLLDAWLMSYV